MSCRYTYFIAVVLLLLTFVSCDTINNDPKESNLYRILVGEKYGFIDATGKVVIEPQYDDAKTEFSEDLCYVTLGDKHYCIDKKGDIKFEVADTITVGDFKDGFARISGWGSEGIINNRGKLIAVGSRWVSMYKDGDNCFIGVADIDRRTGELCCYTTDTVGNLISGKYSYQNEFKNGLCAVKINKKWGFINAKGELVIDTLFDKVESFNEGLCAVKINNKCGFINTKGELVIDTIYDAVSAHFEEGLAAFAIGDRSSAKVGYINTNGDIVVDTLYSNGDEFYKEGITRVAKGDKKDTYIDKTGKVIIPVEEALSEFSHNRAVALIDGKKYLIDRSGNKIKQLDFERYIDFRDDDLAVIMNEGKVSIIDTMGNTIGNMIYKGLSPNRDFVSEFHNGCAVISVNSKYGVIDRSGNEIIKIANEHVYESNDKELFIVTNTDYIHSYYDYEGHLIWQDLPSKKVSCPTNNPVRKDFIEYFDSNISTLDPIEGIYYVTDKNYYQDRDNFNSIGLNDSHSEFYAIAKPNPKVNEFWAYCVDGTSRHWVNKFVKLGDSNSYAITKINKYNNYSSEGRMTLDNPNQFDFRLETGKNNWYNFFVTYEFVRDYPPVSDIETYQRTEWTGTGFAFADGYIATNHHVTNGAKTIRIKGIDGNNEKAYKGYVVVSDKEHDLSIVKIVDSKFEGFGQIPYKLGKSSVDVGDDIFVLGYPMTSTMGNEIKLTDGIISSSTGFKGDESMYQISAAVQPGNSGGPVFNEDGSVIGIVCGKHSNAENANYAIKVSYLYSLINSANINVEIANGNKLESKKMSSQVKIAKDFVYLIECSSK